MAFAPELGIQKLLASVVAAVAKAVVVAPQPRLRLPLVAVWPAVVASTERLAVLPGRGSVGVLGPWWDERAGFGPSTH